MEEVWVYINEEKIYQISNLGRVKSCARYIKGRKKIYLAERVLKLKKSKRNKLQVAIYVYGKQKTFFVHELVAKVFVPNKENKKYVYHISNDVNDNRVENLQWGNFKYPKRVCYDCKVEKNIEEFYNWNRDVSCGKRFVCKVCDNIRSRNYRENNREKEKIRRRKKYLKRKRTEIVKGTEYKKRRAAVDPGFKLLRNLRDRHRVAVKNASLGKNFRTTDLLGCDSGTLKLHFEALFKPDMSWDNYGRLWNIDHIYPLSRVNWENKEQVAMACNYKNLTPQYVWINNHKRAKLNYYETSNDN